jgi:hypothetical protein
MKGKIMDNKESEDFWKAFYINFWKCQAVVIKDWMEDIGGKMDSHGDKSKFENRGLDEQEFHLYRCPACGYDEDVAVFFEPSMGMYLPLDLVDTVCTQCHKFFMERA